MRPDLADTVFIDFETEVSAGYSLGNMSTRAYVQDSRFKVLMVAVAEGASRINVYWRGGQGAESIDAGRARIEHAVAAGKWIVCHNVKFDGLVARLHWNIEAQNYFDTMGYLAFMGMGASLENGGLLVGVPKREAPPFTEKALKDSAVRRLFMKYNATDVLICREIAKRAIADGRFPDLEFEILSQTCRENLRGLRIDRAAAADVHREFVEMRNAAHLELSTGFQDFDPGDLRRAPKVKAYLLSKFGVRVASLDKRKAELAVARASNSDVDRFLGLRARVQTLATFAAKAHGISTGAERLYGAVTYYGSHTGRFSSGGRECEKLNIQALPKGKKGQEHLARLRRVLVPELGESWVSSDLNTIEPRVLAFLAGEKELVDRFASGEDVYIWFAGLVHPGVRVVKGGENDHLRHLCKAGVIGLGYGMGWDRFWKSLVAAGVAVEADLARKVFDGYRGTFKKVRQLLRDYWSAFKQAWFHLAPARVGLCEFSPSSLNGDHLGVRVTLPTGRSLFYRDLRDTTEMKPYGCLGPSIWYSERVTLPGAKPSGGRGRGDSRTHRFPDGSVRTELNGSTLIENIVQAVARDILVAQAMEIHEQLGLRTAFSVHDELVEATGLCRCSSVAGGEGEDHMPDCPWIAGLGGVEEIMSRVPARFPRLQGLPVACEVNLKVRNSYG